MSVIDGKNVIGSGVVHFKQSARVDPPGAPSISFTVQPGIAGGFSVQAVQHGLAIDIDIQPGEKFTGITNFPSGGATYNAYYEVIRYKDLVDGQDQFYAGSFSITDG
ncbi:hypothetical protein [Sphingomonas aquatilis]|uniref:hypothetical protein n=1 Tax=Sphingomonas aquatilis TaxID=93063 RepID=UPI0023F79C0D|nr:hypothetical protein [Sphingomonas aquatilis]MCI4653107.1 hypothetical protein [Sphingomonas aquatilis]